MAVRKPQTEKKAKGLIKGVGDYKGKTLNLTKKQLGKKGTVAAKKRTVSISNTKYDSATKKVTGPAGKPLTGKVDLGGGNMAVYKNGVRVRAVKKVVSSGGGGGGGGGGTKTSPYSATKKKTYSNNTVSSSIRERTPSKVGTMSAAQANKLGAEGPKKNTSKSASSGKDWWSTPVKESLKGPFVTGPKRLDTRKGPKGMEIYNGSKWILMKK